MTNALQLYQTLRLRHKLVVKRSQAWRASARAWKSRASLLPRRAILPWPRPLRASARAWKSRADLLPRHANLPWPRPLHRQDVCSLAATLSRALARKLAPPSASRISLHAPGRSTRSLRPRHTSPRTHTA